MWLIAGENPLRLPRIIILTHAPDLHYYQPKAFPVHFQDLNMSSFTFSGQRLEVRKQSLLLKMDFAGWHFPR
jgi:hypothetical protein